MLMIWLGMGRLIWLLGAVLWSHLEALHGLRTTGGEPRGTKDFAICETQTLSIRSGPLELRLYKPSSQPAAWFKELGKVKTKCQTMDYEGNRWARSTQAKELGAVE